MQKLFRAILMTLPIDQKGTVARTYRRELAKLEEQGRARRTGTEWVRTMIGDSYVKDELDQILRPGSQPPARNPHESGTMPAVRAPAAPPPPPVAARPPSRPPVVEPTVLLKVTVPQSLLEALDARARGRGTPSRAEEVRTILLETLTAPARPGLARTG